jgi:hypothetical protein
MSDMKIGYYWHIHGHPARSGYLPSMECAMMMGSQFFEVLEKPTIICGIIPCKVELTYNGFFVMFFDKDGSHELAIKSMIAELENRAINPVSINVERWGLITDDMVNSMPEEMNSVTNWSGIKQFHQVHCDFNASRQGDYHG